ncbi:hypothetical protein K474DRAFT_1655701 [Panus rudis PR-1116 ss-1]|nr:hypothetical protein K474DRAFT_1655701 [Panus rudis PR-1116 ss-1]
MSITRCLPFRRVVIALCSILYHHHHHLSHEGHPPIICVGFPQHLVAIARTVYHYNPPPSGGTVGRKRRRKGDEASPVL